MPQYRRMEPSQCRWLFGMALAFVVGCAHAPPLPIDDGWVVQQVSSRYHEFFAAGPAAVSSKKFAGRFASAHDPPILNDEALEQGLLRPRFGLPAIVQAGTAFPIELLERRDDSWASLPRVALLQPAVSPAAAA